MKILSPRKEMSVFLDRQKVRKRRDWMGKLRLVERALISTVIVFAGLACLYVLYQMVFMGETFAVKKIVVDGKWRNLSAEGLSELSGVKEGDNLFWIDVKNVREKLGTNPWVMRAAVKRRLPSTLWMFVEEHAPAALVLSGETLFYVDAQGRIFKELDPGEAKDFPVITGIEIGSYMSLSNENSSRLADALNLLGIFSASSFGSEHGVSEVHFDRVSGYSIILNKEPMQVLFGQTAFDERVRQLDEMMAQVEARQGRIQYILVNEPGRMIVKS